MKDLKQIVEEIPILFSDFVLLNNDPEATRGRIEAIAEEAYQVGLSRAKELVPAEHVCIESETREHQVRYAGYNECRGETLAAIDEELKDMEV